MPETVKAQLALAGAKAGKDQALIYAEGRRRLVEQPVPAAVAVAWLKGGAWAVGKRVGGQGW